ncbi:MAG TPA: DUF4124 domain-containing protein [Pseudomonas xinjiangensis]|uniref:DUF4124 domain-containing protein n=2 Tax=root TaxID=1 RepID=A0A7V1FRC9_9GAMM|nr:DUF4124 domain-containing protein [Halopseudomonas xinjiangensis]HEC46445.1 DUF4124 domain-containing protein [Halopseudomonas xinjiangensis]
MYKVLTALILGLACSGALATSMYTWTDAQGRTQYGQQPPANQPYQRVDIKSPPPPGGELRSPAPLEMKKKEVSEEQQASQKKTTAEAQQRALECEQLKANLSTLTGNPRLSRTNDAGEVERISEEERQDLITKTRSDLETYCQ